MKPTKSPAGLDGAAGALKRLVGARGFVRRDISGRALFVSDFPRRQDAADLAITRARLESAGWLVETADGLARLDWPLQGYRDFLDTLPLTGRHGLSRIFRRHQGALTADMLPLARQALRLWDAGDLSRLARQAGAALAGSLRRKNPVPACYAPLLDDLSASA